MINKNSIALLALLAALGTGALAYAEETVVEKVETKVNKATDTMNSTARDAQDKVCEMVDGKMKCFVKKVKHKTKTLLDKTKTKTTEIKNKID